MILLVSSWTIYIVDGDTRKYLCDRQYRKLYRRNCVSFVSHATNIVRAVSEVHVKPFFVRVTRERSPFRGTGLANVHAEQEPFPHFCTPVV